MSLAEEIVKEQVTQTPFSYGKRVRWLAAIYILLDLASIAIMTIVLWRVQYFITLAQRSNVETLTIAIVFILGAYYLVATSRGFMGALRILWYDLPKLWTRGDGDQLRIERRKQHALKPGGERKSAYFDKAVVLAGHPDEPLEWELEDEAGSVGKLVVNGVEATLVPATMGLNNSIFEFLATQIEERIQETDPNANLQITQWSTIDADEASAYFSIATAFRNLRKHLGTEAPVWPTIELSQADVRSIGDCLRSILPAVRSESFLPDLEFGVEYNVPILPEPLGFMKLSRSDNRADPVVTMGCAGLIMIFIMVALTLFILLPPWLPAR